MAVAPYRLGQALGFLTTAPSSGYSAGANAAANWVAFSFVPDAARTLSAYRCFATATGTLAGSDVTCDLYDSTGTGGAPGSSIETGKLPSATITTGNWYDFTGFTTALAAGQMYWLVFKNANGTPASNFPTFSGIGSSLPGHLTGNLINRFCWGDATSTNSGSTWSSSAIRPHGRVSYADGSFDGVPLKSSSGAGVGDGVYATRESGVKFTTPANGVLQVAGIAMYVSIKSGSPTGNPQFGIWTGVSPSNLAYTNAIQPTSFQNAGQWIYAYFASTQTIQPATVVRVTLAETTQSDASGNRFNNFEILCDTDSNSLALLPWEGTCQKTYFDGSSWTDTAGSIFGHALLLGTSGEFGSSGGSSSSPVGQQWW